MRLFWMPRGFTIIQCYILGPVTTGYILIPYSQLICSSKDPALQIPSQDWSQILPYLACQAQPLNPALMNYDVTENTILLLYFVRSGSVARDQKAWQRFYLTLWVKHKWVRHQKIYYLLTPTKHNSPNRDGGRAKQLSSSPGIWGVCSLNLTIKD